MLDTLVGVFVFSVMWSELLMTSAINCPLWSSVYECQRVECAFTSHVKTKCGMFVMYCMQYVHVSCFVVCGFAVTRTYIHICNCDMFIVVNVYLDQLKLCVVCIDDRTYVCCSECNVISSECVMSPHPALCNLSARTVVKLFTLNVFALGMSLVS